MPLSAVAVVVASAVATAPESAGSHSEHSVARPAARRPLTRTSARRPRRYPWPRPMPSHSTAPTARARSPPSGQLPAPSSNTTSAAWRSRAGPRRWRAAVRRARPGGRTRTASTPERRSPAASAQPAPGCGTKTTRRRSSPRPAAATTPGSGRPTAAHQLPDADAAPRRASARVVAPWPGCPVTVVVVPRRSEPPGKSGASGGGTGRVRPATGVVGRTRSASPAGTSRGSRGGRGR